MLKLPSKRMEFVDGMTEKFLRLRKVSLWPQEIISELNHLRPLD